MIPRIEDVEAPVVGKWYMVPCVQVKIPSYAGWKQGEYFPIIGELHEDREVIGFNEEHVHPDFRFVRPSFIRYRTSPSRYPYRKAANIFAVVISKQNFYESEPRRFRCHQSHPLFPRLAAWQKQLEAKYAKTSARCMACPHRGISLKGAPVENGAYVCPGHGLAWNTETLKLQPR
jgi:hypothetical protein